MLDVVGETRSRAVVVVHGVDLVQLLFYLCSAKCRGSMMGKHIPSGVG